VDTVRLAGIPRAIEVHPKNKCCNRIRANPMKMESMQVMSMLSTATMFGFPATATAGGPPNPAPPPNPPSLQSYQFQNAAQNVSCNLSSGDAACEISNRAARLPRRHHHAPSTPRGGTASC
jgi:hypothetical protein